MPPYMKKNTKKRNTRDCVATKAKSVGDTRTCGANLLPKSLRDLDNFRSNMMIMNSLVLKIIFLTLQSERGTNSGSNGGSFVKFG